MPKLCELTPGETVGRSDPSEVALMLATHALACRLHKVDSREVPMKVVSEKKRRGQCHAPEAEPGRYIAGFVMHPGRQATHITAETPLEQRLRTILHETRHVWQLYHSGRRWSSREEKEADADGFTREHWPKLRPHVEEVAKRASRQWTDGSGLDALRDALDRAARQVILDVPLLYATDRLYSDRPKRTSRTTPNRTATCTDEATTRSIEQDEAAYVAQKFAGALSRVLS